MGFGIEGELTRLVPLDADKHLENAVRWLNDPTVTEWLGIGYFPISKLAEREWFEANSKLNDKSVVFAIETLDGTHIGFSDLHMVSHLHKTAHSGSLIGDTSAWGKGYGTDAARTRANYAFKVLGLRQLFSKYLEGNVRSKRMQEKVGYTLWGVQPDGVWKNGAWRNLCHTVLRNPDLG